MKVLWGGLTVVLSVLMGVIIGVLVMWLAMSALKTESMQSTTFWTHVLGHGYLLPLIALGFALFSPYPVVHTGAITICAGAILYYATRMWIESYWYPALTAATLVGCAAARLIKNQIGNRVVTP